MKIKMYTGSLLLLFSAFLWQGCEPSGEQASGEQAFRDLVPEHVKSSDFEIFGEAFLHGYSHNIIYESIRDESYPTLTIQCVDNGVHKSEQELLPDRDHYSVWTRDLYWGFKGWVQAGDDRVLEMMKTSLLLLIEAKARNQALGQSELWPLNNQRFYIPQAYVNGLKSALSLYPWCSESQADFLLLAHDYWAQSADLDFIRSIWEEILYVTETLELLDTDGNALPDALQGSYDYMWIKEDSEEPLMCAKTSLAYQSVAKLAREMGDLSLASHLESLALRIKETMNKPLEEGGLWKENEEGGHYVQMRVITPGNKHIEEAFIPYNNLVPIWCGMTTPKQEQAIFNHLDRNFNSIYNLEYGPIYCAPAGRNEQSVMDCSSVTWLAFLDVYLRGVSGHKTKRSLIYQKTMDQKEIVAGVPFPEGAGVYGYLTGGAGRSWDNGNFFHLILCGIYGIEKDRNGIAVSDPNPLDGVPLSELKNVRWRDASYHMEWKGSGTLISKITLNGRPLKKEAGIYLLEKEKGSHEVEITLSNEP